jgi:hypothetical protein
MSARGDAVRDQMAAEIAALRQRAEAAEREVIDAKREARDHLRDLCAERDLKRTAYAKLDDVRKVVEETIIPALEAGAVELHCVTANDCKEPGEMPSGAFAWGHWCNSCGDYADRNMKVRGTMSAALSAARKTLED